MNEASSTAAGTQVARACSRGSPSPFMERLLTPFSGSTPQSRLTMPADRPLGHALLGAFFAAGALISTASALALVFPGSWLEPMWHLNPEARVAFAHMGPWAVLLMVTVAAGCATAALGVWAGRRWGHRLALGIIGCNLLGDLANAILRGDPRTLLGLPIGGALLVYLLRRRTRDRFRPKGR
jgi:hypothetical protein